MKNLLESPGPLAGGDAGEASVQLRWEHVLAAAVFGAICAKTVYGALDLPQRYAEPIVGNVAWHFANKFHDYAAPVALVAGFLLALQVISALSTRIARRAGAAAEGGFRDLLVMPSALAGAWIAGLLTTRSESLELLEIAAGVVAATLVLGALLSLRPKTFWQPDSPGFAHVLGEALLGMLAIWLAVVAAGVASSRMLALSHSTFTLDKGLVQKTAATCSAGAAIALVVLILVARSSAQLERVLHRSILLAQLVFPGFFLILVPQPWNVEGRAVIGYPLSRFAWGVVAGVVVVALADVGRKIAASRRAVAKSPLDLFSVMSVIGVLLFLKAMPVGTPWIPSDDYHFGESLVPWWSLVQQRMIPFVDYSPVRGLLNYFPGAASALLFDGKASTLLATTPFQYLAVLLVAVPPLRRSMNLGWAALALLLAPYINMASEIDVVVTAFVATTCRSFGEKAPTRWLVSWTLLGGGLLLFAPGQGGLAIVATGPLALIMATRAWAADRRVFLRSVGALAVSAMLLGLLTPLGPMVLGAIRYGMEQSGVNSVAHGIAWIDSFRSNDANPWLFEMMRASWLLVSMWAGVLVIRRKALGAGGVGGAAFPYAISILILTTLYVARAAGRIDAGFTRLILASIWALALLLPLLLHSSLPTGARGLAVIAWVSLAGLVIPHSGGLPKFVEAFKAIPSSPALLRGDSVSLAIPAMGAAATEPAHLARLQTARAVLDRVLDPGETYLDLTNRHAQYFYLDRRPPIETGAAYNLVAEAQQLRAITALRREAPPAVLVSADNMLHDGGPVGLRAHLLYRYVLLMPRFKVVATGGQVWLVREDRVPRLAGVGPVAVTDVDDAPTNPLHQALRAPDLESIPASWGRSARSLEGSMQLANALQRSAPTSSVSVQSMSDGGLLVTGPDPQVRFDVSGWNLAGRDGGILSFDFECEKAGPPPVLEIYWASAGNEESELTVVRFKGVQGHLMVPLDAAPAWLLATKIRSIRFDVADERSCRTFRIENVKLFQRHGTGAARRS